MKKVTLPADANPTDMQALAQQTTEELSKRIGVDGVFVFCLRRSDDSMGAGYSAPDLPIDVMIGCVITMLAQLRNKTIAALKKTPQGT